MIRRWLARRKAQKQYIELVSKMRLQWHVVQVYETDCYDTSYGGRSYSGAIVIAAEENELGERRLKVLSCPKYWSAQQNRHFASVTAWVAKQNATMPPKPEMGAVA